MLVYPAEIEVDAPFHLPACKVTRIRDKQRTTAQVRLKIEPVDPTEVIAIPVRKRKIVKNKPAG